MNFKRLRTLFSSLFSSPLRILLGIISILFVVLLTALGSGPEPVEANYVGLTEAEARKLAKKNGLKVRITGRDGQKFAITLDYRRDRINFDIENDIVVKSYIG